MRKPQQSRRHTCRATLVDYTMHDSGCVSLCFRIRAPSRPVETEAVYSFTVVCPLDGGNNYWVLHFPSPPSRAVPGCTVTDKRQCCSNDTFPLEICRCWDLVRHVLPAVWLALKWRYNRFGVGNSKCRVNFDWLIDPPVLAANQITDSSTILEAFYTSNAVALYA